jgi:hypothetical protein
VHYLCADDYELIFLITSMKLFSIYAYIINVTVQAE